MTLDAAALADTLEDVFASLPETAADAAAALAAVYYDYASTATFGPSAPEIPTANRDALASALEAAISVPAAGSPATFAGAWAAAVTLFWIGVPVVGVPSGATVGCPGAASLAATLTTLFANLANTATSCAAGLATALHGATSTVTAAVAPPPGTVLPIA